MILVIAIISNLVNMFPFAWKNVGNDFLVTKFSFEKICEKHVYQRLTFQLLKNSSKQSERYWQGNIFLRFLKALLLNSVSK